MTAFRTLAINAAASIGKGDRVIVAGRIRIREWSSGERSGTSIEVDAEVIGHDLGWGTTEFQRVTVAAEPETDTRPEEAETVEAETSAPPVPALLAAGLNSGRVSIIPVGFAA